MSDSESSNGVDLDKVAEDFGQDESSFNDDASDASDDEAKAAALKAALADDSNKDDSDSDGEIVDTLKKKPKKKKSKKKISLTDPSEGDDEEDAAMKELLANWEVDNEASVEDDDDDSSDSSDQSEREVELDENVLDHIVLACSDLEKAMKDFKKETSLEPVVAGTIKGLGIKCARVSFTDASYLEIIAPDPKAPGPIGELIKSRKIDELTPFHYAIRTARAEELKDEVAQFGYVPDHITMFGAKKDGTPRKWEMLYLYGHKIGGICPFFINWDNSDHPCATLPVVGKLKKLMIRAPKDDPVHKLYKHADIEGIELKEGKPKFSLSFKSPEGTIKYETKKAVGFKFPGFEADNGEALSDSYDEDVEFEAPEMPEMLPVENDVDEE